MFQLILGCSFEKDAFFHWFYLSLCAHACACVGTEVMGSVSLAPGIKPLSRVLLLSVFEREKRHSRGNFRQTQAVVFCTSCALQNWSLRFSIKQISEASSLSQMIHTVT